jgi:hypothetical protein
MKLDPNPNNVIPGVIDGAVGALKSAYKEPSVVRFVFTSSSSATVTSAPNQTGIVVKEDTWNEDAVKEAWAEPPYTQERAGAVYAASKTQSEQAIWKYHKEHRQERPDLVVNAGEFTYDSSSARFSPPPRGEKPLLINSPVLPNFNFGPSIDPVNQGFPSSSILPVLLDKGQVIDFHRLIPRRMFLTTP